MSYNITEIEMENMVSIYWQMHREIESNRDPRSINILNDQLIKGAYNVLNRCGITDARPEHELKIDIDYPQNREESR